jgi:hypothetical protein
MKFVVKSILTAAILLAANLLHAQETAAIPSSPANLPSLESYSDAQLEQVLNELSAMPLIWPTNLPDNGVGGTYWSLAHPNWPPLPSASSIPVWEVSSNFLLLDDIDYPETVSANSGIRAMGMLSPMDSGGGGFSPSFSFLTNGLLWLQITNLAGGTVYANLNNATDQVYSIWSTTNLTIPFANWQVETEVWPTDTNTMPFTVETMNRQMLFLRAEDWTGVTANGNQTPLWWFWEYYDTTDLSDTNLDSQGNTLLYDYQNGLDPNVIQFSISVTNQYINSVVPMQLSVTAGQPFYIATLVDDTNFEDAVWNAYTSSVVAVDIGLAQGWHNVYVGLRGFPANATQTWQWRHLDFVSAPILAITNPVSSDVDEPIIQIYGYAQEQLANITYDISNASGTVTNEPGFISDEYFDTNQLGITTNYFQCLDVPLTNGLNVVTLHATDLAGDTTVSNFNFTLDYSTKTNPPVVQFMWPQPGTEISGTNCMFTGSISDPTASLTAENLSASTNAFPAYIDRTGNFWLENVSLQPGSNTFLITATDAAGNIMTTNFSVVQTNFVLTVNQRYK